MSRTTIRGRKTASMIRELGLVVPGAPWLPVYRVSGNWEKLVESRQALEWGKAGALGVLAALVFGSSGGSSDLVQALHVLLFWLLAMLALAALDAIWVARHANDLELVDRASSGIDEWRADRARQRSTTTVLCGALLLASIGCWMLWAVMRPASELNPWVLVPMAALLVVLSIRAVVRRLLGSRRAPT